MKSQKLLLFSKLCHLYNCHRYPQQSTYLTSIKLCGKNQTIYSILSKSENATPELFAIYMQNYANQEYK